LGSDEDFAVKIFSASHRVSEGARARFEREARIARELDIDAVCRVLTTGENEGRIWFAMQLVRGKSLAARITQTLRMRARSASALPHAVLLPTAARSRRARRLVPNSAMSVSPSSAGPTHSMSCTAAVSCTATSNPPT
jgi:serine/threonine protein kinase